MKFIDLFAGLGGFHQALVRLNHSCVFASEINKELRDVYETNFGIAPAGDIRSTSPDQIPAHDILCAGFPCQPFSKAGDQEGFECPKWGDLFDHVLNVVRYHQPSFVMLENVPNLERHDDGATWATIKTELEQLGYQVKHKRLSPHRFGIPQIRERMFIVCSRESLDTFEWPTETPHADMSIESILDSNPRDAKKLTPNLKRCLSTWQKFIKAYPSELDLPTFPVWSMEFAATYPFEEGTPYKLGIEQLRKFSGSHGQRLKYLPEDKVFSALPSYARTKERKFPKWKIDFIRHNRELYREHKSWLREWMPNILEFSPSQQKLEWNYKGGERNIWQCVIQIRASGVRVKRKTTAPSLIAMTTTQVPIIGWERRYMTPRECARLQSMGDLHVLPKNVTSSYKALGNAVNVTLVEKVAQALIGKA